MQMSGLDTQARLALVCPSVMRADAGDVCLWEKVGGLGVGRPQSGVWQAAGNLYGGAGVRAGDLGRGNPLVAVESQLRQEGPLLGSSS